MNNLKYYLINLKRRTDRLENFFNNYPLAKENVEIIYGFDGKNYNSESDDEKVMYNKLLSNLLPGEKGCFISHFRIFNDIVKNNIPFGVIMEDDCSFCENFKNKFEEIINEMPLNTQILYFGGRFNDEFKMKEGTYLPITNKIVSHTNVNWEQRDWTNHDRGTFGYIISNSLAKFFIECFNKNMHLNYAIDHWIIRLCMNNKVKIYNSYPLLTYSDGCSKDSDIRGHLL